MGPPANPQGTAQRAGGKLRAKPLRHWGKRGNVGWGWGCAGGRINPLGDRAQVSPGLQLTIQHPPSSGKGKHNG